MPMLIIYPELHFHLMIQCLMCLLSVIHRATNSIPLMMIFNRNLIIFTPLYCINWTYFCQTELCALWREPCSACILMGLRAHVLMHIVPFGRNTSSYDREGRKATLKRRCPVPAVTPRSPNTRHPIPTARPRRDTSEFGLILIKTSFFPPTLPEVALALT